MASLRKLDSAVVVGVSFHSSRQVCPDDTPRLDPKQNGRRAGNNGELVLQSEKPVSLTEFVGDLETDYELISVTSHRSERGNSVVQFTFVRREFAKPSDFDKNRWKDELLRIVGDAAWELFVYDNPYVKKNGNPTPPQSDPRFFSVSCARRKSYVDRNGAVVKEWEKDDTGMRTGTEAVPYRPKVALRIVGNAIKIVPNES